VTDGFQADSLGFDAYRNAVPHLLAVGEAGNPCHDVLDSSPLITNGQLHHFCVPCWRNACQPASIIPAASTSCLLELEWNGVGFFQLGSMAICRVSATLEITLFSNQQ